MMMEIGPMLMDHILHDVYILSLLMRAHHALRSSTVCA